MATRQKKALNAQNTFDTWTAEYKALKDAFLKGANLSPRSLEKMDELEKKIANQKKAEI